MTRRYLAKRAVALFLVGVVLLLAGCRAVTSAYVAAGAGAFVLTVPENCDYEIAEVIVKYYGDDNETRFEDLATVWSAIADGAHSAREITLFHSNDGFTVEQTAWPIDTSKELIVSWRERWSDGDSDIWDSVVGVLDQVEGEKVLWFDGVTSRGTYQREVSSPLGRFRC